VPSSLQLETLAGIVAAELDRRNRVSRRVVAQEAGRLAAACREMSVRFARGGRLIAYGRGAYATDAQHVAVEFVHPVIVGKRALPALNASNMPAETVSTLVRADDMVIGFAGPDGDGDVHDMLVDARARGAQTLALTGTDANYALSSIDPDPFAHQELVEIAYHVLWESVHVFLEHREGTRDVGPSAFLYPFLGRATETAPGALPAAQATGLVAQVTGSILAKAEEDETLRRTLANTRSTAIATAVLSIHDRLCRGGSILVFGNGGSATDANDFAFDCLVPSRHGPRIAAISLAHDSAIVTALANDIGREAMFHRQVLAYGRRGDVALAISTSGGSDNLLSALEAARKIGMTTVALLGRDGGEIVRRELADIALVVPSTDIPRIQEVQASIYHIMIDRLRALLQEGVLELFGAAACPYTAELREHLEWERRLFVEHDVEADTAARDRLVALTGTRTVPVLVESGRIVAVGWRGRSCTV
jgi:D-sedoheptulose 7-phosphate isomerase